MILLDTHVWIWYLTMDKRLNKNIIKVIDRYKRKNEAYLSSISIWEVCKLHEKGKIKFSMPLRSWLKAAITKGILVKELSLDIYLESCSLPGSFHDDPVLDLTEKLVEITPDGLNHIFYGDSGSIGVEIALKMALQYRRNIGKAGKNKFVALRGAYHGDTFGCISVRKVWASLLLIQTDPPNQL